MTAMTQESRVVGKFLGALREDLNGVFVVTEVSGSPSEPNKIISARICLGIPACFGKFCFKLPPRFSSEWWRDLFGTLQACLREYGGTTECQGKKQSDHAAILASLWSAASGYRTPRRRPS